MARAELRWGEAFLAVFGGRSRAKQNQDAPEGQARVREGKGRGNWTAHQQHQRGAAKDSTQGGWLD